MKLNDDILSAVRKAIDYYGNTSQFAQKVGVSHSTVHFWLSGKTGNISGSIWDKKLRRKLRPFMTDPENSSLPLSIHEPTGQYLKSKKTARSAAGPDDSPEDRSVPAVGLSSMDRLDITMQSPVSFVRTEATEKVIFANSVTEYSFALLLDRPEYCPGLPLGTPVLIIGGDYAENDDIVVAHTRRPARLCFARYVRDGAMTRLIPLNPDFAPMEWNNHENAEKVFWLFPVREINIELGSFKWIGSSLIRKDPK